MAAPGRLTEVAGAGWPVVRWEPQSPFCQILGGASCFLSNAQFFVKWETLPHTEKKNMPGDFTNDPISHLRTRYVIRIMVRTG